MTDTLQDVKNRLCIDGHLNHTLDLVLASNEPDAIFSYLTELSHKAAEMAWAAARVAPPEGWRVSADGLCIERVAPNAAVPMIGSPSHKFSIPHQEVT